MNKLYSKIFITILAISFLGFFPRTSQAACSSTFVQFLYYAKGAQPPASYDANNSFTIGPGDRIGLAYGVTGCTASATFTLNQTINSTTALVDSGPILNGDTKNKDLLTPTVSGNYTYTFKVTEGGVPLAAKTLTMKLTVTPSNTPVLTPTGSTDPVVTSKDVTIPGITDSFNGKSLLAIGLGLINILLALIVIAAVVVIVIAGFRMTTGGANPEQLVKAKKTIIWAIVGLAVAMGSFAIVQLIQSVIK